MVERDVRNALYERFALSALNTKVLFYSHLPALSWNRLESGWTSWFGGSRGSALRGALQNDLKMPTVKC